MLWPQTGVDQVCHTSEACGAASTCRTLRDAGPSHFAFEAEYGPSPDELVASHATVRVTNGSVRIGRTSTAVGTGDNEDTAAGRFGV